MYIEVHEDYSPHPRLAVRVIRFANVRFGILPSQSERPPGRNIEQQAFRDAPCRKSNDNDMRC